MSLVLWLSLVEFAGLVYTELHLGYNLLWGLNGKRDIRKLEGKTLTILTYCGGLEPNLQYLQGMPVVTKPTSWKTRKSRLNVNCELDASNFFLAKGVKFLYQLKKI